MSNLPLVSIGILNYNGLKYLKKTIPAILKLNYLTYEIIVVDNASTDESTNYLSKFKNIRIIKNKENLGYSKGKNICVKNCNGKYILLLDEDILIKDKRLLNKLIKIYDKKKNIGFIQIPLLDEDKLKTFYYGIYYSIYGLNMHRKNIDIKKIIKCDKKLIPIVGPTGASIFCSRKNLNKIGLFDESQGFHLDDVDIGPRSNIFGFKNYLYTKNYFIHLGIKNTSSIKEYSRRFKLVFSGHARSMIKNYKLKNLILRFPIFCIFQVLKAIKYSIKKRSFKIMNAFFYSVEFFLKNLLDALKERKKIQSKRKIKEDSFLKIKPPKFD